MSRLIRRRAVYFYGDDDKALIVTQGKDGLTAHASRGNWHTIGTPAERHPFTREHCLTYDEVHLAALISFSSDTIFLNDGARNNNCHYEEDRRAIEGRGVIIGVVGARFEKADVMEHRDVFTPRAPRPLTAVDRLFRAQYIAEGDARLPLYALDPALWATAYGTACRDALTSRQSLAAKGAAVVGDFFPAAYQRRMRLSFDTVLLNADHRARAKGLRALIHFPKLGLTNWRLYAEQEEAYLEGFFERVRALAPLLQSVSDIRVVGVRPPRYADLRYIAHITILFWEGPPGAVVHGQRLSQFGKLLVFVFSYDGNAYAGNEFWDNLFAASGDPAAACASQIAEIFNPYVNPRVGARSLAVATRGGELISLARYLETRAV